MTLLKSMSSQGPGMASDSHLSVDDQKAQEIEMTNSKFEPTKIQDPLRSVSNTINVSFSNDYSYRLSLIKHVSTFLQNET